MIKVNTIEEAVKNCLLLSKILKPYSYPTVSADVEDLYLPYRTWNFKIDGYDVCVHMSEFSVYDSTIQNIQIFPKKLYTLPFHMYFKIAVAFLGKKDIINFSIVRHGHIVSCWTKMKEKSKDGAVDVRSTVDRDNYLGIDFGYL